MFKFSYATEAEIPADHKAFYEARDGAFFLKVEGAVARSKLDEFRDNNHTLTTELKVANDKLKTFDGIDPVKAKTLMDREQEIMDEKLVKAGKIEEVVTERMATAKAEHQRNLEAKDVRIKELEISLDKTGTQLKQVKIHNVLLSEAQKRGLQPGAEPFLMANAEKTWDLDEKGNPVAKDANGKIIYGTSGDPMKPSEWMDDLQRTSEFMFKPNSGSGAPGDGGRSGGSATPEINPFKTEHWNPGKQMEIYAKDRPLAERLAAAAGKRIGQM